MNKCGLLFDRMFNITKVTFLIRCSVLSVGVRPGPSVVKDEDAIYRTMETEQMSGIVMNKLVSHVLIFIPMTHIVNNILSHQFYKY